jgi:uncharacterized membrane protein (TIGR02234 family)
VTGPGRKPVSEDGARSGAPHGSDEKAGRERREFTVVLAAAVLGAALVLFAGSQTWAEVVWQRHPALPPTTIEVGGGDAAPLAPAAGLVLLAAAAALLAVRGTGRAVLGVLMVAAGVGAAWASGRVLGSGDVLTDQLAALGVTTADYTRDVAPAWPVLGVIGGVLGAVAGLLAVVRGRRWPAMGRRYERAGAPGRPAPAATDEQRAQSAWTALDRGVDPTSDPPEGPADRPL